MTDDLTKRRPADADKINVNQAYELQWWADLFRVSPEQIKDAVGAVGVMVVDVKKHLGK